MINRYIKETLNLACMQIGGYNSVGTRFFEQIGYELCRYRLS